MDGEYYRALPIVPHDDPHRAIWKIRAKHFARLLQMLGDAKNLRVLDIGAGNGWLSNQLAAREHSVAAVDLNDDRRDGLGARVNYANAFECYQAEFDCLPFSDAQFDFVIFNASLHYASSLTSSLAESQRVLAPRGSIIILDSPFYTRPAVKNFLTLQLLRDAAHELNLEMLLAFADDVWHKLARRKIIELKIGREPAHFPIIRLFQPPTSNI
ncbi:MAG: class I SAM-dependent methyltransferase [Chloroflexi bacterium]|nr:class I SAM-dependent methyltransferase [Chloroflexota bacterium]